MSITILLICLMSPSDWVLSDSPPDSIAYREILDAYPVETVLFMARTQWIPEWFSEEDIIEALREVYSVEPETAVFCTRLLNRPASFANNPLRIEYSYESEVDFENPDLYEPVLRGILHKIAYGSDTEIADEFKLSVVRNWLFLKESVQQLVLEVFGEKGISILDLDMLSFEELSLAGNNSMARYFSEIGYEQYRFPDEPELNTLGRVYAARCCPQEDIQTFLSDSSWAVRYTAVQRCDPVLLGSTLSDSVLYVSLEASIRQRDAGIEDGGVRIRELTAFAGPVGVKAIEELSASDALLLLQFMDDESPAKRFAAQSAWLSNQLPVNMELEQKWISDSYWLMPVQWAYEVFSRSENTHTEEIIAAIWDNLPEYSNPAVVVENVSYLETMLYNETADDSYILEEYPEWNCVSLPFDPDTVAIPEGMIIETDAGSFIIEFYSDIAPLTCAGFCYLASSGFYDGVYFHRVIPGFVAQAGCPEGNGIGGPGYTIPNERSIMQFSRGTVGMADAGLDTGGSQFFIMLDTHGRLDGRYTAFGQIVNTDELDEITVGTRIVRIIPVSYEID